MGKLWFQAKCFVWTNWLWNLQGGVDPKDAKQFFLVLTNWLWNGVTSGSEFSSMQRMCSVYIALPKSLFTWVTNR
jgi:hypothetical protein